MVFVASLSLVQFNGFEHVIKEYLPSAKVVHCFIGYAYMPVLQKAAVSGVKFEWTSASAPDAWKECRACIETGGDVIVLIDDHEAEGRAILKEHRGLNGSLATPAACSSSSASSPAAASSESMRTILSSALATSSVDIASAAFAASLDGADPVASFRAQFHFPSPPGPEARYRQGYPCTYLCGNSLGLQPLRTRAYVNEELDKWSIHGVEGHFKPVRCL